MPGANSVGGVADSETPEAFGPRNCGHQVSAALAVQTTLIPAAKMESKSFVMTGEFGEALTACKFQLCDEGGHGYSEPKPRRWCLQTEISASAIRHGHRKKDEAHERV